MSKIRIPCFSNTMVALRFGFKFRGNFEVIKSLRRRYLKEIVKFKKLSRTARETGLAPDWNKAMGQATQSQFFREASEAAKLEPHLVGEFKKFLGREKFLRGRRWKFEQKEKR